MIVPPHPPVRRWLSLLCQLSGALVALSARALRMLAWAGAQGGIGGWQ
jgi:hypothetical protein